MISEDGIKTEPEKIKAIEEWQAPKCVSEVRSFLGLTSYYRRFIKNYADIAQPLTQLTQKNHAFVWAPECKEAFEVLKRKLTEAPILGYPSAHEDYILDTDASGMAIGAVLSQVRDGQETVISYFSKALNGHEKNYCIARKELLAVVFSVRHFKQYLYGRKFIIRTDHAAFKWLMRLKEPEGQLARWLECLSEYDFFVEHRTGTQHKNTDALTRQVCNQCGRMETPKHIRSIK